MTLEFQFHRVFSGHCLTISFLDYEVSGRLAESITSGCYSQPSYVAQWDQLRQANNTHNDTRLTNTHQSNPAPTQSARQSSRAITTDPRLRQFPHISPLSQLHGAQGSTVRLHLQSPYELRGPSPISFFLSFASKVVKCSVLLISDRHIPSKQYTLSAQVPAFASTGCRSPIVPLRAMMAAGYSSDSSCMTVDVGDFTYTDQALFQDAPRKRRLSSISEDRNRRLLRKNSLQQPHDEGLISAEGCEPIAYTPFVPTAFPPSPSCMGNEMATPPRPSSNNCSNSTISAPSNRMPTPCTPASSGSSIAPANNINTNGDINSLPASQDTAGDASTASMPPLIRTSTLHQTSPSIGSTTAAQNFNPYAIYPSKAALKLTGDLNSVVDGWSLEEWDAKRRLVQFTRQQQGSTIHAGFKVIAPEDRQAQAICISCIWWQERKECFVTSVDTIFLLESLVAVRFTVEEKNRIRRNLEGFRPLTVSKSRDDSEDFFKTIMGFPHPKPRNIEKDVKVFPWRILAHALKKIISKYSASYSSTASALTHSSASHYAINGDSDIGIDPRISMSPQLNDGGRDAHAYAVSAAPASPATTQVQSHGSLNHGFTDLRLDVPPVVDPTYSYPASQSWGPGVQYPGQFSRSALPISAPADGGQSDSSWNMHHDTVAAASAGVTANQGSAMVGAHHVEANASAYRYNHSLNSFAVPHYNLPANGYRISQSGA